MKKRRWAKKKVMKERKERSGSCNLVSKLFVKSFVRDKWLINGQAYGLTMFWLEKSIDSSRKCAAYYNHFLYKDAFQFDFIVYLLTFDSRPSNFLYCVFFITLNFFLPFFKTERKSHDSIFYRHYCHLPWYSSSWVHINFPILWKKNELWSGLW